ncbi:hypothetical protein KPL76_05535 [Subtercola sp. PAMC28395]|uniref:Ig-like domain-containing protein n=1 Tax=Subtercola sp. PAMC28395 TaxID=2846775 RepID=UPI001C0E03F8|nr:hypothetical protein [Subtercola sp. PAMC28395]QWT24824.1 hypothetical protein KPL76_05535 [Subtercola sp. PAMC28395]
MPRPFRHPRANRSLGLAIASIAFGAAMAGGGSLSAAAAPLDDSAYHASHVSQSRFLTATPFDVKLSGGIPDFGYRKQGTTTTQSFTILNTGDNDITIDPAALTTLTSPFTAGSIGFTAATILPHNSTAAFNVAFTAPAAGTSVTEPVVLTATDRTDGSTKTLTIIFVGRSIATDPVHFAVGTNAGGSIEFGSLAAGGSTEQTVSLFIDGVVPIAFDNNDITVTDSAGNPSSNVTLSGSSFGGVGTTYRPGQTATFSLAFAPTAAGTFSGNVHIVGHQISIDPEQPNAIENVPFTGIATVAVPTPTPTPTPTSTPTSTSTPTPTSSATPSPGTGGSGASGTTGSTTGTSSKVSSHQLASTGFNPGVALLIGALVVVLGSAAATFGLSRRRSSRS